MDILAAGEPLLEFNTSADAPGPVDAGASFTVGHGGDTSNFCVAARRSGADTGYITRIGDDDFGASFLRLWEREGVSTEHVVREPDGRTGIYFIARTPAESSFTYFRARSPASRLAPADMPAEAIARARLLHLSGITQAISASACDAAFQAIQLARDSGTLVSYDPNLRPALWPAERARAVAWRSVELCDIALPNLAEGRLLTGLHAPDDVLAQFVRRGPSIVVLKMGDQGALLAHAGTVTRIPPHPVDPVDTTGAGDTFDGAFAARLLAGATPEEAARYAAVAAALTTTGPGAVTPIPRREDVDAALRHLGADRPPPSASTPVR